MNTIDNIRNKFLNEIEIAYENVIPIEIRIRKRPRPISFESPSGFSAQLKQEFELIFNTIGSLAILWDILPTIQSGLLLQNEWFKSNFANQEYSDSYLAEILGGNLNICSANEILTDKEHLAYLKTATTEYLPFDRHWSLTACLKSENGKVENNLYLFNAEDPEKPLDMKIGLLKYLQLAYEAKAFYHWQYAYLFKDSLHNERLRVMLPVIFPHVKLDLNEFGM